MASSSHQPTIVVATMRMVLTRWDPECLLVPMAQGAEKRKWVVQFLEMLPMTSVQSSINLAKKESRMNVSSYEKLVLTSALCRRV